MSRRRAIILWAAGLLFACTIACSVVWALGMFATSPDATVDDWAAQRLAQERARVIELIDAAPRMNAGNLKSASLAANRVELLKEAGFLAFAWQARYQIDREVYPRGVARNEDRGVVYFPPVFWARGGKPRSIQDLEGQPAEFRAAIDRFLSWEPRFEPGYDPGWKYDQAIDNAAREQVVADVLEEFRRGLRRLADNYSIPEYAMATSQYALARDDVLVSFGSLSPLLSAAQRSTQEEILLDARRRLKEFTPLMRDAQWKFLPETRWHELAGLDATDYFEDDDSIALCRAIEADDIKQMEALISAGVDINRVGKNGMTVLLWAMPNDRLERFECLLRHGADPNVALDGDFKGISLSMLFDPDGLFEPFGGGIWPGDSVMTLACRARIEYLTLVLRHGGNPNLRHAESGEVPLDIVERLDDRDTRVSLLLDHGADATLARPRTSDVQQ